MSGPEEPPTAAIANSAAPGEEALSIMPIRLIVQKIRGTKYVLHTSVPDECQM